MIQLAVKTSVADLDPDLFGQIRILVLTNDLSEIFLVSVNSILERYVI
jgi:hypothetical protein